MLSRLQFLRQHLLLALLALSCGLGAIYCYVLFPPWQLFLHSDNIIPYIMTVEPWARQDFFYWGAERFGALYAVFWKVLGHPLFGVAAEPFFLSFFAFFFLGTAFWLAAIRSWFLGICFFLLMLPLMPERIDEFLYPGHVYGTLYFLIGVISWLIVDCQRVTARRGVLLAVLCALAYWQHLLAGLIMVVMVGLAHWYSRLPHQALWRYSRPFWSVLAVCLALIEQARGWAIQWGRPVYSHIETWAHFVENLREFSTRGLTFELGPVFGLTLVAVLVLTTLLGVWVFIAGSDKVDQGLRWRGALALYLCLAMIGCILLFNGHAHYTENGRHERYFSFLVPLVILAIAVLAKAARPVPVRVLAYLSMGVLTVIAMQRELVDRSGSIFDQGAMAIRTKDWGEAETIVRQLKASGCQGVLDDYWHAYRLTGFSNNQLAGSAVDFIRNPVYFDKVRAMASVCIADRYFGAHSEPMLDHLKPLLRTHDCKRVELDYWLCRLKAH